MPTKTRSPRRWLLSVASTGMLVPGCAQDHDDQDAVDQNVDPPFVPDGGILVNPDASVAGVVVQPDAGWATGLIPFDGGIIASPVDAAVDAVVLGVIVVDAGIVIQDAAVDGHDAAVDAGCVDFWLSGIIAPPSDGGCIAFPSDFSQRDD